MYAFNVRPCSAINPQSPPLVAYHDTHAQPFSHETTSHCVSLWTCGQPCTSGSQALVAFLMCPCLLQLPLLGYAFGVVRDVLLDFIGVRLFSTMMTSLPLCCCCCLSLCRMSMHVIAPMTNAIPTVTRKTTMTATASYQPSHQV